MNPGEFEQRVSWAKAKLKVRKHRVEKKKYYNTIQCVGSIVEVNVLVELI